MTLRINGERLWQRLMDMARIGATPSGGCNRQALTDEDKAGRDLFVSWAKAAGCHITIDAMGNIFARRRGRNDALPPVLMGSHLDTQPTGGKFDGVYGVLAGLEVMETLDDAGIATDHPLEVAVWTNEEGARFNPAMIGSGVFAGVFTLEAAHDITDKAGRRLRQELGRIGYLGTAPCQTRPLKAAFEVHIEQGPILESTGHVIGRVTGVQGMRWYDVVLEGVPVHAGPTPMKDRRDVFRALGPILTGVYDLAAAKGEWARATFGDIAVTPGVRNTVPATLRLAVDLRHPDEAVLEDMDQKLRALVANAAQGAQCSATVTEVWRSPAVRFADGCLDSIAAAAASLGYAPLDVVSGAGHDSVYLARVVPTAMIFIPCTGGISHNEAEDARPEHIAAGADVLLHAVLDQAGHA
jgi:N-carbamoyl-L-amino-acid hydrolase